VLRVGWLLSLGLCLAGLVAVIVEFFVPAAGIIGVLGFGSIVTGVVLAFLRYGTAVGTAFLVGAVVATPAVIALYFKLFPKSFVGRWLILRNEQKKDDGFASFVPEKYEGLKGKEGTALTILRPSGMARIEGVKYSVVTAGEFIQRNDEVIVSRVEGSRIVVKAKNRR
jgi:membrane-bound serine protease (ClpP class)